MNQFSFKIGGEAGYGIMSAGLIFCKTAIKSGYYAVSLSEYPSLIRGGHNVYHVSVSSEKIYAVLNQVDILIALNENSIDFHKKELSGKSHVIINSDKISENKINELKKFQIYPVPLISLAKKINAPEIVMNNVALGSALAVLDGDFNILANVIKDIFKSAKQDIIDLNIKAARLGFDYIKDNFQDIKVDFNLKKRKENKKIFLSGNEGIALGAVKAGLKFFVCYPMTPINSILTYLAKKSPEKDIVYVQPEDEISAINMAIGAAHTGARAMTATSGGGFALMVEGYGLAGMTETPLVITEGQRPGPATGLPTWGNQGDLKFVLNAAHDDFLRIVLAPGDPEECFKLTALAFNLAEKYQTPVVVITDKHLSEGYYWADDLSKEKFTINRGDILTEQEQQKEYKRYKITSSGISPRAIPGRKGNVFVANSDEHTELGFSEESVENRKLMYDKRMRKLETCKKEIPNPKVYGDKKAKIVLVGWGSSKGPILEAQKILEKEKIKTQFLHLTFINPLPERFLDKFFSNLKKEKVLMIEQNYTAQCAGIIKEKIGFDIKNKFLKYDGRQFFPEEIVRQVKKII